MKKFVIAKLLKVGSADAEEYLFPKEVVEEAVNNVQEQIRKGCFFCYTKQSRRNDLCSLMDVIGVVKSMTIHEGYLWADIEFVDTKAGVDFRRAVMALHLEELLPDMFVAVGLGSSNSEDVVEKDYQLTGVCLRPLQPSLFTRKKIYEKVG